WLCGRSLCQRCSNVDKSREGVPKGCGVDCIEILDRAKAPRAGRLQGRWAGHTRKVEECLPHASQQLGRLREKGRRNVEGRQINVRLAKALLMTFPRSHSRWP